MAALPELWESLKSSITTYTGLSPATFFTVIALTLVTYYIISGLFGSSSDHARHHASSRDFEELEPLPPPVQLGEITEQELRLYDGSDAKKPLLMAIKGQIYDVSQSRVFYGPGGPYALFAGRDASRALAKMSFEEKDLTSDISGLGVFELDALQDWEYKFMSKYVKVGTIKKTVPVTEGTTEGESSQTADAETSKPSEAIEGEASKPVEVSPKATEATETGAAETGAAETGAAETEAAETEAAKIEDAKPVEGHAQTIDGNKDYAGNVLVTDADKKE